MTQKTVKFDENVIRAASAFWKKAVLPEFSEAPTAQIFAEFLETEANNQLAAKPEDPSLVSLMCQIQRLRVGQSVEAFGVTLECRANPLVVGAMFEVGKRYATDTGDFITVESLGCGGSVRGRLRYDGRMHIFHKSALLPGAIEEPAPAVAPVPASDPAPKPPAPIFKLGDYARRRDGVVVGPLWPGLHSAHPLEYAGITYQANGMNRSDGTKCYLDLVDVVPAPCPASPPESLAPERGEKVRPCTCPPDDAPAICAGKYALHECVVADLCGQVRAAKARADKAEKVVDQVLAYMRAKISPHSPSDVDYWRGFNHALHAVCEAAGFTITPAVAVPLTVKWSGK